MAIKKKKKRRTKTAHQGVTLTRRTLPSGSTAWRARYQDPDTSKVVFVTLDLPTHQARVQWCIRKADVLIKRRMELATGAPTKTATPIATAIEIYVTACSGRLRDRTIATYREALDLFAEWATDNGIVQIENLSKGKLSAFRDYLANRRKQVAFVGSRRGRRREATKPRSGFSINRDLHSIKAVVNFWRNRELLPLLSKDAISDALKNVPTANEAPEYLPPSNCRLLLEAALRHDGEIFIETRDEHAGLIPPGSTRRYQPIAPFTLFLLFSGCRSGEALNLRWQDVDFDALDAEGRKVGEIRLLATMVKTKRYRSIGLEVCPSIKGLLSTMKLRARLGEPYVFGGKKPLSQTMVDSAKKRLIRSYGAPEFTWQNLRQTTGTFLTNSPGIYGAASVFMSARQLGHSVAVAEKFYLGVIRGIPREARTLEAAMQIEDLARQVVEAVGQPQELSKREARNGG
jgi:integrase